MTTTGKAMLARLVAAGGRVETRTHNRGSIAGWSRTALRGLERAGLVTVRAPQGEYPRAYIEITPAGIKEARDDR